MTAAPAGETVFALPDLGEGLQEAEIVLWHVAPGDRVVADQPLVSVETAKAVIDVPAPHAGRIARVFEAPGDHVAVGAPLVAYESAEAARPADRGAIVGSLPVAPPPAPVTTMEPSRVRAAPAVRALATRLGVELAAVTATGPTGEVTIADVEQAAAAGALEPLRGVRRAMARNMAASRDAVVPATVQDDADIDSWPPGADVTVRLVRAMVAGCLAASALNSWYDPQHETRRLHARVDIGLAVEAVDGLFVPVIRDAGTLDAAAVRAEIDTLEAAVRARTVAPDQMRGATIGLSNFGTLGGRHAALVVMPPQVAILGAGRIESRPVAVDGRVAAHRMLPLSLTFDHRVVTGGEAATFLMAVIADLARSE